MVLSVQKDSDYIPVVLMGVQFSYAAEGNISPSFCSWKSFCNIYWKNEIFRWKYGGTAVAQVLKTEEVGDLARRIEGLGAKAPRHNARPSKAMVMACAWSEMVSSITTTQCLHPMSPCTLSRSTVHSTLLT